MAMSTDYAIREVMKEKGVSTREIPEERRADPKTAVNSGSRRYFRVKGFASFDEHVDPGDCHRTWKSAHAWCVIDLKEQRVAYRYKQECQSCDGELTPDFDEEALRKMAEYVVDYKFLRKPREVFDFGDMQEALDGRGPHDEDRCGMCKELGRSCWKK